MYSRKTQGAAAAASAAAAAAAAAAAVAAAAAGNHIKLYEFVLTNQSNNEL